MKQVAQNYRSGELAVLDVPAPSCAPGGVVIRSAYSLISTGTELMKVGEARMSLLGKARARPDQVRKVLDSVAQQGAVATYQKVTGRLDSYTPLGYSLAGVVTEVGEGAGEFHVGQLVAAAGNEHALHAEYNWVPTNLCVPVPDGVAPEHAAFATVGAIAMHGVRRAEVQLGETACVIGLGLVGQLTVRLLVAAGVRVFGIDVVEARCRDAEKAGALLAAPPTDDGVAAVERALLDASGGVGADHVLLAAGGSATGPVETAARLARDRARVVDIGKCRLDLPWNAYYDKELDVRFSRSYGPGRYDEHYELDGVDYPVGYVRWTERRNLASFLDLIAREQLEVATLVSQVFPVEDAPDAYRRLHAGEVDGVGFLFEYPGSDAAHRPARTRVRVSSPSRGRPARGGGALRLGFVGAGNYATSALLPALAGDESVTLAHVATTRSLSAVNAQRRFGFDNASTDVEAVLADDSLDALFVVTRHGTHADLVCRALATGRAVFVEKPLALTDEQLQRVVDAADATSNDRLMVGFNRRFSRLFTDLRAGFGDPGPGASARYLVNAGRLDARSWYLDQAKEGSRFTGEGGHFLDTMSWWLGAPVTEVYAVPGAAGDDLHVSLRFANASFGSIDYLTDGNPKVPKETFDASADGRNARLDNFRTSQLWRGRRAKVARARQEKGQRQQLRAFLDAVRTGGPMPIPFESLVTTTRATLAVGESLAAGKPVRL